VDVTIFGCEQDEAALFRDRAPFFGITPIITSAPVPDDPRALAVTGRCVSVGHKSPVGEAQLSALSAAGVEYISTRSVGIDHIDVGRANSLGITVENVAYSPDSVADHTLMLMLMAVRQVVPVLRRVEAEDYRLAPVRGRELRDLTVGVVGTGRIGAAVIRRLTGFGCRVLAADSRRSTSAEYVPLPELLERSDIVTLHTPLDEGTRHLLDRAAFERMKHGAYVVNTGRGGLLDTAALVDALESGRLSGAALDVVEGEDGVFYLDRRRRPVDDPVLVRLLRRADVVLTPHIGFYTDHALIDTVVNSLINCLRFEKGLRE
jgi:D-specific alpha-keto acid dehydrogenase